MTSGAAGRAFFFFQRGYGCSTCEPRFFEGAGACDACTPGKNALYSGGAVAKLGISATAVPSVATSSDKRVVEARWDAAEAVVQLVSGVPGSAEVRVSDSSGREIDRLTLTVARSASIDLHRGWTVDGPTILVGRPLLYQARVLDATGAPVVGCGGVRFDYAGAAGGEAPEAPVCVGDQLVGRSVGDGAVNLSVDGAQLSFPVQVVSEQAITAVQFDPARLDIGPDSVAKMTYRILAGTAPVYGASCAWTMSPGDALVFADGPPDALDSDGAGSLVDIGPGDQPADPVELSCTAGDRSATALIAGATAFMGR
jgi:hypothetical protein